jgi:hypothetical protein
MPSFRFPATRRLLNRAKRLSQLRKSSRRKEIQFWCGKSDLDYHDFLSDHLIPAFLQSNTNYVMRSSNGEKAALVILYYLMGIMNNLGPHAVLTMSNHQALLISAFKKRDINCVATFGNCALDDGKLTNLSTEGGIMVSSWSPGMKQIADDGEKRSKDERKGMKWSTAVVVVIILFLIAIDFSLATSPHDLVLLFRSFCWQVPSLEYLESLSKEERNVHDNFHKTGGGHARKFWIVDTECDLVQFSKLVDQDMSSLEVLDLPDDFPLEVANA